MLRLPKLGNQAKSIRDYMASIGHEVNLSQARELVARLNGARDFHQLRKTLEKAEGKKSLTLSEAISYIEGKGETAIGFVVNGDHVRRARPDLSERQVAQAIAASQENFLDSPHYSDTDLEVFLDEFFEEEFEE